MRERDVIEILAVLDVVKNIDVYKERLDALRTERQKLEAERKVELTVEQANDLMDRAKTILQDAEAQRNKMMSEGQQKNEKALQEVQELMNTVKSKMSEANSLQTANIAKASELTKVEQVLVEKEKTLKAWDVSLSERKQYLNKKEREHEDLKRKLRAISQGAL